MPLLVPQQPPPPDYYVDNLRKLLTHVLDFSGDLLAENVHGYAQSVLGCSTNAGRLFARLISRKGPWIRVDRLVYPEIGSTRLALGELVERGLVEVNAAAPADALLSLLTTQERKAVFPGVRGGNKADWILNCLGTYNDALIRKLLQQFPWVRLTNRSCLRQCQLLFFGADHQDMSTFVLSDLGLVRYAAYALHRTDRMFASRGEFDRYLDLRRQSALSHRLDEHPELAQSLSHNQWQFADIRQWQSADIRQWQSADHRHEQRQRDRILNRLGRWFERRGAIDDALACYARSASHPARERRVRLLRRLGDVAGSESLISRIRKYPWCAEEVDFAERFPHRRRRVTIETTVVPLAGPVPAAIEDHCAALLTACGGCAWHMENQLSLGIAGLAFWDAVFTPVKGAFVNPFQSGPLDLFWPDFAVARSASIEVLLRELADPGGFRDIVNANHKRHFGVANRLVSWRHWPAERLQLVLRTIPHKALLGIASHVIHQPYRARTGFPDLVVIYGAGGYEFVEVKGPTDQLQPAQRVWLKTLERLHCPARVVKFRS